MMKRLLLLLPLLAAALSAAGQEARPWEALFADLSTLDDMESGDWEDTYEMLCELEQAPIDLNSASREELLRLPFLNDRQVEDIHEYLYRYGAMKTTAELAMIPSIDYTTRQLLSYFTVCRGRDGTETTDWRQLLRRGHHEVVATGNIPFYERRGDKEGYLGYPYKHSLRYRFQSGDRLKVGLLGAQDAGEPFFAGRNKAGYDFYSFYAEVRRVGALNTLVAGRYDVSFGMGLVMGSGFSMGKLATLTAMGNKAGGLKIHSSRSIGGYLQGAGATVRLAKGLEGSAFVSYRKIDATLTDGDSAIATIVTDGYHRTATEMAKKDNAAESTAGGHLQYRHGALRIGATGTFTHYNKELRPRLAQRYRTYYPAGSDFWNASIDYAYTHALFTLHGETAIGEGGAIATVNSVGITPSSRLSLLLLQRFYGKKYHSLHAASFSEGGRVQNESGVYAGIQWLPLRHLKLTAYTDYAYFPFATYSAQVSSQAWDNMVQAQYERGNFSLTARYRLKIREQDNAEGTALITKTTHRARVGMALTQGRWRMTFNADGVVSAADENSRGWMCSAAVDYSHAWLKVNAGMGYFHTDDYESRIYGYEQGVLYAFGFRPYDGEGIRWSLNARADIGRRWMFIAHLSTTDYFDRDHISSSYQRIDRSSKTDLELQVRCRF